MLRYQSALTSRYYQVVYILILTKAVAKHGLSSTGGVGLIIKMACMQGESFKPSTIACDGCHSQRNRSSQSQGRFWSGTFSLVLKCPLISLSSTVPPELAKPESELS